MYADGNGVLEDHKQAVKWYRLAAEQGFADAQIKLAGMYRDGHGVPKSNIWRYALLNLAAANGNKDASDAKESLAAILSAESLEVAQELSRKLETAISAEQVEWDALEAELVAQEEAKNKANLVQERIYNACLLDKSSGIDMQVESLRRVVEETCKSIAQDPGSTGLGTTKRQTQLLKN